MENKEEIEKKLRIKKRKFFGKDFWITTIIISVVISASWWAYSQYIIYIVKQAIK